MFAEGGAGLGITPATLASLTAINDPERPRDEVMGVPSWMSLGFLRPGPELDWGSSRRAFGTPGAGGSFGFADPDTRLGFAYVMNKMVPIPIVVPIAAALVERVYEIVNR